MIPINKALKMIERESTRLGSVRVPLADCVGRILADDIVSDTDMPPFDRSQMDGFAVIAGDTANAPVKLKVIGESSAGHGWKGTIGRGMTVAIMTGARVPVGADAVQKIELTARADSDDHVRILEAVSPENSIVRRGGEIRKGATIFRCGEAVTENMIASLAAFGYAKVKVAKQPRVAILGTGNEIVDIAKTPGRDQIRNSNSVMLDVMSRRFGALTTIVPMVKDDIGELTNTIASAAKRADLLVITGGVSVGKYDHTKTALEQLGAAIYFEKVRLKPGKPAVFARLGKTLVFGLPGNPVSAAVTFHLFVRKAMLLMQGANDNELASSHAVLAADARAARERDTYVPSRLNNNKTGQAIVTPQKWQGSSDFVGFSRADSLIYLPKGSQAKKGDVVKISYL